MAKKEEDKEFLKVNPHLKGKDPISRSIAERKGEDNISSKLISKVDGARGTFYPELKFKLVGPPCDPKAHKKSVKKRDLNESPV